MRWHVVASEERKENNKSNFANIKNFFNNIITLNWRLMQSDDIEKNRKTFYFVNMKICSLFLWEINEWQSTARHQPKKNK